LVSDLKFLKETSQRVFFAVFYDPEKSFASRVNLVNESHVVMAFLIGDFINSKSGNPFEFAVFKAVINHPLHGAIDFVP